MQPGRMPQAGRGGQSGDGDEADVGLAGGEARGALGGHHAVDAIAAGERGVEGRMLEIPHQRGGIEKVNGCNAQPGIVRNAHSA